MHAVIASGNGVQFVLESLHRGHGRNNRSGDHLEEMLCEWDEVAGRSEKFSGTKI
jgi:hypothetical protein